VSDDRLSQIEEAARHALDQGAITSGSVALWLISEVKRLRTLIESFDPEMLALKGYGHFPGHTRDRNVIEGDWPYTPSTCAPDVVRTKWVDKFLVCEGCGLDCT
jgi:hypothetical protein